jgi:hypothetical protein
MDQDASGAGSPRTSTVPSDDGLAASHRSVWWRRGIVGVLTLFVLAAITQQLGVRADTVRAASGDLEVTVRYADRARGALAAPFEIGIEHTGGFEEPIEVRSDQRYLAIFDDNGFEPEPASVTTEGGDVIWTFDPPPGTTLTVVLDARIEPGVFGRQAGSTSVEAEGESVRLEYTTWVAP